MKVSRFAAGLCTVAICALSSVPMAHSESAPIETTEKSVLLRVQSEWARINYQLPPGERAAGFESLTRDTESWLKAEPNNAEALIWHGIVLSSHAGAQGGLGALSLVKEARTALEKSLQIDPAALQGSAHTSLATLYSKVPGFPIGFGSDKKARAHFEKALAMNPAGIDPNYFYAEYLANEGETSRALEHLRRAMAAPDRPGRAVADTGRRGEIQALLTTLRNKK